MKSSNVTLINNCKYMLAQTWIICAWIIVICLNWCINIERSVASITIVTVCQQHAIWHAFDYKKQSLKWSSPGTDFMCQIDRHHLCTTFYVMTCGGKFKWSWGKLCLWCKRLKKSNFRVRSDRWCYETKMQHKCRNCEYQEPPIELHF